MSKLVVALLLVGCVSSPEVRDPAEPCVRGKQYLISNGCRICSDEVFVYSVWCEPGASYGGHVR